VTALEEITQAIDTLERLRADSTIGPWGVDTIPETGESHIIREFEFFGVQIEVVAPGGLEADDANLIVTLHRTIDAQLDLLRTASGFFGARITGPEAATLFAEHALQLARAVNEEAS
jgi:hypothetical protein